MHLPLPASDVHSTGSSDVARIERRAFLASCSAMVLAIAGCQSTLAHTRLARLALDDPHPDDYRPILRTLITTILPLGDPRFPAVSLDAIEGRLFALFPLEEEERYLALQRALMIFNQVDLFPVLGAPIAAEERAVLGATDADIDARAALDRRLYAEFLASLSSGPPLFTGLEPRQRAGYLALWRRSGFNAKKRFYRAAKSVVLITAYSMDPFWHAIGYAGPLLKPAP